MKRLLCLVLMLSALPCTAQRLKQRARSAVIGGAAASTPDTIFGASLKRWYRADSTVCGGGACADTNSIDTFTDKNSAGNATFNAGSTIKMKYVASAVNSQPGASCLTGSDCAYDIAGTAYTPTPSFSGFAVVKMIDTTSARSIFSGAVGAPTWMILNTSDVQNLRLSGSTSIGSGSTTLGTASWHKIAFTYNSSTGAYAFYIDGDTNNDGSGTNAQSFSAAITTFGARASFASFFEGTVADTVIVDGIASGTQITQMMGTGSTNYFCSRYALC